LDKASDALIRGLLDKARGKLTAAEEWFAQDKYFDEIASRCYYAAFHAAQALLLTEGLTADTHQGIVSLFGLHFAKAGRVSPRLGRYLNNLKDDRESGDYDVYSGIDRSDAERAVREASEFLAEAERYLQPLLSDPAREG
jgi:uncharacterized protein (UPF0332 family)